MKSQRSEVVVVTGASAGVGRATAEAFGPQGALVALLARGTDGLEAAAKAVEAAGGRALAIPTDVARADQVETAARRVEEEFGPIDVWVNDAMVTVFAPFEEITPEEFTRATEVTYLGTVFGTMAALRRMTPRDRGSIVQVGSALSYRAIPLQAPYCGAKHAVRGFTNSVRTELLHDKSHVRLSMVHLPALNTPQFDWCATKLPDHPMSVPPIYQPPPSWRTGSSRGRSITTWDEPATHRSSSGEGRSSPTGPRTCSNRCPATPAPTGSSTGRPTAEATRRGPRCIGGRWPRRAPVSSRWPG